MQGRQLLRNLFIFFSLSCIEKVSSKCVGKVEQREDNFSHLVILYQAVSTIYAVNYPLYLQYDAPSMKLLGAWFQSLEPSLWRFPTRHGSPCVQHSLDRELIAMAQYWVKLVTTRWYVFMQFPHDVHNTTSGRRVLVYNAKIYLD